MTNLTKSTMLLWPCKIIGRLVHGLTHRYTEWQTALYTWFIRHCFYAWGRGSRIRSPSRIDSAFAIHVGKNVMICEHAWLNAKRRVDDSKPALIIQDGVYIGRFVQINAWQEVIIEENALIADRVFISDVDHTYGDRQKPIIQQPATFRGPVIIGRGSWLGIGTVILAGTRIGRNAVVAANAVVTEDVPDFAVVGGIPAKILKITKDSV